MRIGTAMMFAMLGCVGMALADEGDDAAAMFMAGFGDRCLGAPEGGASTPQPDVYTLRFKSNTDGIDAQPHELTLYRFLCTQGAYNATHVFLSATEDGGLQPVYFAQPTYSIIYDEYGADEEPDTRVLRIQLTGVASYAEIANSEVDPVSGTIVSTSYWRGAGDASAAGEWRLMEGVFTLVRFDVDASYDGEVNPVRLVNYLGMDAAR